MTAADLVQVLLSLCGLVGGQVLLKFAMRQPQERTRDGRAGALGAGRRAACLTAGIGAMTVWFMLWLGLMQRMDLSLLFPFEALASILLAFASSALLRERVTPQAWAGIGLITLGVLIVGLSAG